MNQPALLHSNPHFKNWLPRFLQSRPSLITPQLFFSVLNHPALQRCFCRELFLTQWFKTFCLYMEPARTRRSAQRQLELARVKAGTDRGSKSKTWISSMAGMLMAHSPQKHQRWVVCSEHTLPPAARFLSTLY